MIEKIRMRKILMIWLLFIGGTKWYGIRNELYRNWNKTIVGIQ